MTQGQVIKFNKVIKLRPMHISRDWHQAGAFYCNTLRSEWVEGDGVVVYPPGSGKCEECRLAYVREGRELGREGRRWRRLVMLMVGVSEQRQLGLYYHLRPGEPYIGKWTPTDHPPYHRTTEILEAIDAGPADLRARAVTWLRERLQV